MADFYDDAALLEQKTAVLPREIATESVRRTDTDKHFISHLLPFLCLLPLLYGLLSKLRRHGQEFIDAEAVICAGHNVLAHASPYDIAATCPGMQPSSFVYSPIAAWVEATAQSRIGIAGAMLVFGFIYFALFAALLRAVLRNDDQLYWRAPFLLSFSASGLLTGNISLIFHGALFFLASCLLDWPVLLWLAVVLTTVLKPTFVVYSVIFLFQKQKFGWRIFLTATALLAIGSILGLTYEADPHDFMAWLRSVRAVHAYLVEGHSIMAVLESLGIHQPLTETIIYVPYALLILAAGLAVTQYGRLTPRDSMVLGIMVCLLLYPRMLDYDEYTLPFGLAVLAASFRLVRWPDKVLFRRIVLGACAAFLLAGGFRGGLVLYGFSVLLLLTLALQLVILSSKAQSAPIFKTAGLGGPIQLLKPWFALARALVQNF